MQFNLIIPSVGSGNRFFKAGYKTYKPFIQILEKRMIDYVMSAFDAQTHIIIIASQSQRKLFKQQIDNNNTDIYYIDEHNNGPAYSIFKILPFLKSQEHYFIAYNDIIWQWNINELKQFISAENPDGIVFTHKGFHPHLYKNNYSAFCKVIDNKIIEIREKQSFTSNWMDEYLSVGLFYYKNKTYLEQSITQLIYNDTISIEGEFYPSVSFNWLINQSLNIMFYNVTNFVHVGIPEQLLDLERWRSIFKSRNQNTNINFCMMLCGKGERMQEISKTNKAGILINSQINMYQYVLQQLNASNYTLLVNHITNKLILSNEAVININDITNTQTESLQLAVNNIVKMNNTLFISNDCFAFIDYEKLSNISDADLVVLGFRPSLLQQKQNNSHSYIEYDKFGFVINIKIKEVSNTGLGLAGMFYVINADIFKYLLEIDAVVYSNFDSFVNYLIGKKIKVKFVEINNYVHLGTPEEFKEFLFWQKYYKTYNI